MSDQSPAPGWYPAPHANNEQRYWDGVQWAEPTTPASQTQPANAPVDGQPETKKPLGLAIAALAVGVVAFFTGLLPFVGALLGLIAIALGVIALIKKQHKGLAITGLALGAVALIASIAVTAGISAVLKDSEPVGAESTPPSASPSEEAAPEPSDEPSEPAAPAAPLVARQDFSGNGDMVIDVNLTEAAIVSFSCPACTGNTVLKTNGSESLLVNVIDAYSGTHLININDGGMTTQFFVEAEGDWSMVVDDLSTAPIVETSSQGTGDSVVIFTGSFSSAAITNNAESNFAVLAYGEDNWSPLIVNEIGAYSGTVEMHGPAVVQVNSSGAWSITGQ